MKKDILMRMVERFSRDISDDADGITVAEKVVSLQKTLLPGWHFHDGWELRASWGGSYLLPVSGREIRIPHRHVLLIPSGVFHLSYPNAAKRQNPRVESLYVTILKGGTYVGVQNKRRNVYRFIEPKLNPELTDLMFGSPAVVLTRVAEGLSDQKNPHRKLYAINLMKVFFSALAEVLAQPVRETISPATQAATKAMEFLMTHYSLPQLDLNFLAGHVGLAPTYLVSLFKNYYQKTIRQTLIEIRLEKALFLLREGKYSVKEVAYLTGWNNQLYFSKVFHHKFGHPPSSVRRLNPAG
jgi:AraC-like DNA-binding protein